jgi:MoxR-like ATPase
MEWRQPGPGPFKHDSGVKQGYLYPIAKDFIDKLFDRFADHLPQHLALTVPAQQTWLFQARPDIWDLAAKLKDRSVGDHEDWLVTDFRNQMEPGQPVVLWQAGKDAGIYAIGELTSLPFERPTAVFRPDRDKRGPTEWVVHFKYTHILAQPILKATLLAHPIFKDLSVIRFPPGTNFKVTREQWEALKELLLDEAHPATLRDLADSTYLALDDLEELEALLKEKRQLVLEGPPGSGKTFLAEHFARYFAGLPLNEVHDERVETVQFHQSYGYEDFVQGIRPVTDEHGQLQYHVLPGIFMRMCDLAARNPDQCFVLIIDEINRGNLSRIFGELLLLLEYRDKRVRLPYGAVDGKDDQAYLSIPSNLYLIGTMNSTDRSLALIDYALRRRFYFYRLLPVVDGHAPVLDRWLIAHGLGEQVRQRVVQRFLTLNQLVERHLGSEFQIGHSYFMREDIGTEVGLQRVWKRAILPLLEEYLHGSRDREMVLAELTSEQLLSDAAPNPKTEAITANEI